MVNDFLKLCTPDKLFCAQYLAVLASRLTQTKPRADDLYTAMFLFGACNGTLNRCLTGQNQFVLQAGCSALITCAFAENASRTENIALIIFSAVLAGISAYNRIMNTPSEPGTGK